MNLELGTRNRIIRFVKVRKTEAIILHTTSSRERDKLVVFLTPDSGKRKGWAYGARSMKTRFGAALEPLAKVNLTFAERESDEIVRIESIDLVRSLFPAQQALVSSIAATYLAETIDTFSQPADPSDLMYRLLDRTCEALLEGKSPLAVVAYAEVWTLKIAGIFPPLRDCHRCHRELSLPIRYDAGESAFLCEDCGGRVVPNETIDALVSLMRLPVAEFDAPPDVLFEIRGIARGIRRAFLGHELKSHDVLQGVLSSAF